MRVRRAVGGALAALALAVGSAVLTPGSAAAAPPQRCAWLPGAITLARSVAGAADARAAGIRAELGRLGIDAGTTLPAECGAAPAAVPRAASAAVPRAASAAAPRAGGQKVCAKFGSTSVPGGYEVQNNEWGSDRPACVRAFTTGFEVLDADFDNTATPAAYPSIFTGCHYGTCTAGTALPEQISALPAVSTSWSFVVPPGRTKWDAAYDIWFDPTPRRDGAVTGTEMMIWLDHTEPQPVGERTATVDLGGIAWDVWTGKNGAQVISYVATTPRRTVADLPLTPFIDDAASRGALQRAWYLTSVQAGFEPWTGGAGLATTAFSVTGVTRP